MFRSLAWNPSRSPPNLLNNASRLPLNTSKGFLGDPDNLKIMSIYRLVWTAVFTALAGVASAQFNPFRELSNMLRYQGPLGTQKTAPTAAKYDPKYFSRWKPY